MKQLFRRILKHPIVSVGVGCIVVGYVLGVATSYGLPRPEIDPAPIQITVAPQGNGAVTDIVMPDIRGLTEATARQALVDRGVNPAIVTVRKVPNVVAEGYVVAQTPAPGTVNPDVCAGRPDRKTYLVTRFGGPAFRVATTGAARPRERPVPLAMVRLRRPNASS
jgi:hypothetical protein